MSLCRAGDRILFFAHVPKTGGSSVQDYLVRRFGPLWLHETGFHARQRRQPDIVQALPHLAAADAGLLLPPDLAWSFAMVRDPVARLQSEYRFQSGVSRASRFPFPTWLRIVLRAAALDPRVYENHIRPQTDLVPAGAEVFRLEDGFDALVARLDAVTGTTAPQVGMGHLLRQERQPIPMFRQDVERILAFHAADYDRFGYPRPDPAAWPADPKARLRDLAAVPLARLVVARHHRRWAWRSQP